MLGAPLQNTCSYYKAIKQSERAIIKIINPSVWRKLTGLFIEDKASVWRRIWLVIFDRCLFHNFSIHFLFFCFFWTLVFLVVRFLLLFGQHFLQALFTGLYFILAINNENKMENYFLKFKIVFIKFCWPVFFFHFLFFTWRKTFDSIFNSMQQVSLSGIAGNNPTGLSGATKLMESSNKTTLFVATDEDFWWSKYA